MLLQTSRKMENGFLANLDLPTVNPLRVLLVRMKLVEFYSQVTGDKKKNKKDV